jgi:anthranilate phosphoribosyltransferase
MAAGMADDLARGISLAERSLDEGKALATLHKLQQFTNERGQ